MLVALKCLFSGLGLGCKGVGLEPLGFGLGLKLSGFGLGLGAL